MISSNLVKLNPSLFYKCMYIGLDWGSSLVLVAYRPGGVNGLDFFSKTLHMFWTLFILGLNSKENKFVLGLLKGKTRRLSS